MTSRARGYCLRPAPRLRRLRPICFVDLKAIMNAFVLPGLAIAMLIYLAVCAWLIFSPERIERRKVRHRRRRGPGR